MRVFDFFWLGRVCLSRKLFWAGIIRQYCRDFTAVTYHIPAPIGIGPGWTAFGLASKKVNELSDYGKVVLFNDGYALNDTAYVLMMIIDGPGCALCFLLISIEIWNKARQISNEIWTLYSIWQGKFLSDPVWRVTKILISDVHFIVTGELYEARWKAGKKLETAWITARSYKLVMSSIFCCNRQKSWV